MDEEASDEAPIVLLIGDIDHEGVLSVLTQSGRHYKKKLLHSNPPNWKSIIDLFDKHSVSTVLLKLTRLAYTKIVQADYSALATRLFENIAAVPNAVFVYEGLFTGQEEKQWRNFHELDDDTRVAVNDRLSQFSLNVIPYRKNSEVTVLAQDFLAHSDSGLLLRLYVPNTQLWASETDRLLQLFRDYLVRVSSLNVQLHETRTTAGVIYQLHGDPNKSVELSREFDGFSEFMNLCVAEPEKAELVLRNKDIANADVMQILTKYVKEVRRLRIDMRQDREQKVLSIRHRLETELLDTVPSDFDLVSLGVLVDSIVPTVLGPSTALTIADRPQQNVTLNFSPQIVEQVNGILAQEITGDVSFNDTDRELLKLFADFAGEQQTSLISALRELNDESAPASGRLTAKHRIKSFLLGLSSKAADVGVKVLASYIEKKMLGA